MRAVLFILISLFGATSALAKPLTEADIRAAKKIVIFMGSFDPTTLGHLSAAEAVLRESDTDLVVILPTPDPFIKTPLSILTRLQILDQAAHDQQQIVYPSEAYAESSEWINQIKQWNPQASFSALIGDDKAEDWARIRQLDSLIHPDQWFVSVRSGKVPEKFTRALPMERTVILKTAIPALSSTRVRTILSSTPELFFEPTSSAALEASEELDRYLVPAEKEAIIQRGLYLGTDPSTHRTYLAALYRSFTTAIHKQVRATGFYDFLKTFMVERGHAETPTVFLMGGQSFPIENLLGRGLHSSVYKVTIDGKDFALKIPKNNPADKAELLRSCVVHRWVEERTSISVPKLALYDPGGEWSLSEYIDGRPVEKSDLSPSSPLRESLENLVQETQTLSDQSQIDLDLAIDNIRIKDNHAYLLDLGPLRADSAYRGIYDVTLTKWQAQIRGRSWRNILSCDSALREL